MEEWNDGTPIAIGGNVEALAKIPLRREKDGMLEKWNDSTMRQFDNWKNGRMEEWNGGKMVQFDDSTIRQWKRGRME